jgi:phosphoserine phosphatase
MKLESINSFVFDFDSTLVSIETFDDIIKNSSDDKNIKKQIDEITNKAMNGELDFHESITSRFKAAKLNKKHFDDAVLTIVEHITPGIEKVIDFLHKKDQVVFILSAGFISTILPVAEKFDIPPQNCFANDILVDSKGEVVGLKESPLIYDGGKNKILTELKNSGKLVGKIVMLGDGMSDCKTYLEGFSDYFVGCGFNIIREKVKNNSDIFVNTVETLMDVLMGSDFGN